MDILSLEKIIPEFISKKTPFILTGLPGIGKTDILMQIAEKLGLETEVVHVPLFRCEDFGIPHVVNGKVEFSIPAWFPCAGSKHGPKGILIFDDRNQADVNIQKVLANILLARTLNGQKMLDGWSIASTGNCEKSGSGKVKQLLHLKNREITIPVDLDFKSWTKWAFDNGIHPDILGFLHWKKESLNNFDASREINATPRSWCNFVNKLIDVTPVEYRLPVFTGCVSEPVAIEFCAFLKLKDQLPDIDKIIDNPNIFNFNQQKIDILYCVVCNIALKANSKNINKIINISNLLQVEYSVLLMRLIATSQKGKEDYVKNIQTNKNYTKELARLQPYFR